MATNNAFFADNSKPQGAFFQDGVRTGPLNSSPYTLPNGAQQQFSYKQWGQGAMMSPVVTYNIVPRGNGFNSNIVDFTGAFNPGYVPFAPDNYICTPIIGSQQLNRGNRTQYLQLDWPQALFITLTGGALSANTNFTIFGYDFYGMPMQESILNIVADNTYLMNKAFYQVTGVYFNGANTDAGAQVEIGTRGAYGLPYAITSPGDIVSLSWGGNNEMGAAGGSNLVTILTAWPTTTTYYVTLNVPQTTTGTWTGMSIWYDANTQGQIPIPPMLSTLNAGGGNWEVVCSNTSGAVVNFNPGIYVPFYVNSLFINTGSGAGTSALAPLGTFTPAVVPTVPGPTSLDVRGTYQPSSVANGTKELIFTYYARGFDNNINLQALNQLPAGGVSPATNVRSMLSAQDQFGSLQYYTGTPA